jgi:hypothetical protein
VELALVVDSMVKPVVELVELVAVVQVPPILEVELPEELTQVEVEVEVIPLLLFRFVMELVKLVAQA